jgi:hypothetical protein
MRLYGGYGRLARSKLLKTPSNPPIGPYPSGQGAISGFFDQPVPRHEFIDAIDLVIWETPNRATEAHKARICDLAKDHAEGGSGGACEYR